MGLLVMLFYVSVSLLSPVEIFPSLTPYRVELVLAGIALLTSVPVFVIARTSSWNPQQFWLVVAFFMCVLGSWLPHLWIGGVISVITKFLPAGIVYFLAVLHLGAPKKLSLLRFVLVATALFILTMGFENYAIALVTQNSRPYVLVQLLDSGESKIRLQGLGILGDPNIFSQFLLILIPMLFVSKQPRGMGIGYFIAIPVALVFGVGIFLTGSRGALLGSVLLVGLVLRQRFPRVAPWISALLALGLIAGVKGGGRSISIGGGMDRLALWSDGMGLFKRSPVWGHGYRSFADSVGMTAHNTFLLCAVETGFIGLFIFVGVLVVTLYQLGQVSKLLFRADGVSPEDLVLGRWAEAIRMSLTVYLFTGFFLSCTYQMPLFLLLGMSGAVYYAAALRLGKDKLPLSRNWPIWSLILSTAALLAIYIMIRLRAI